MYKYQCLREEVTKFSSFLVSKFSFHQNAKLLLFYLCGRRGCFTSETHIGDEQTVPYELPNNLRVEERCTRRICGGGPGYYNIFLNHLFNSFIHGYELMGYFITKLKLQVKVCVEKNSRGFFKLVTIVKEPFDNCLKYFSNVVIGDRQV